MAYHLLVAKSSASAEIQCEYYLGSAASVQHYWESVGEKLGLPIVSSLTEKAESEDGLILAQEKLLAFQDEVDALHKYWLVHSADNELPEGFMDVIKSILGAISKAIENDMVLIIG